MNLEAKTSLAILGLVFFQFICQIIAYKFFMNKIKETK